MPTEPQVALLRAALWEGEPALQAWREWRRLEPDLDEIDAGSHRLLPLLYANLGPELREEPDAARLKTIYRQSWAVNQLGLRIGRVAIEALGAAGIEVLALKGAALIASAYRDPGARPMGDVDLAVRPESVAAAVAALEAAGFAPIEEDAVRMLSVRHSLAFRHPDGQEVDLHRGTLWLPGLDDAFWERSREAEVAGSPARILDPADQLLHVCAHGAAWSPLHPVRWAADAWKTIEAAGSDLDWERVGEMARRGRLTLPLCDALGFLAEELRAPVPAETLTALAAAPVSAGERRAHRALAQPPSTRRSLAMLAWFWERHRAEARLDGERRGPGAFLRYLQGFWGLERPSQVPAYAARRLLRHPGQRDTE